MNGLITIVDKSTLQTLSEHEWISFQDYCTLNLIPVLYNEVLADLTKFEENARSEHECSRLANRTLVYNPVYNVNFKSGMIESLNGRAYPPLGRPLIAGESKILPDGRKGVVFVEPKEIQAIRRWQKGNWSVTDRQVASQLRDKINQINIKSAKESIRIIFNAAPRLKTLDEVNSFIKVFSDTQEAQRGLLALIMHIFDIDSNLASELFYRWESHACPLISNYAPYAFHCIKTVLLFYFGLINDLLSERDTNIIDLEYLFYLPFCMLFSTNDRFQELLMPYLIGDFQDFLPLRQLQSDLSKVRECVKEIPVNPDMPAKRKYEALKRSATSFYAIWSRHLREDVFLERDRSKDYSPEEHKRIVSEVLKYRDGIQTEHFDSDDADFMIRETWLSLDDLCICRSGLKFGECCGKKLDH